MKAHQSLFEGEGDGEARGRGEANKIEEHFPVASVCGVFVGRLRPEEFSSAGDFGMRRFRHEEVLSAGDFDLGRNLVPCQIQQSWVLGRWRGRRRGKGRGGRNLNEI